LTRIQLKVVISLKLPPMIRLIPENCLISIRQKQK
jgi:hypothetical protein